MRNLDSQTVFDFATTTGGFYEAHKRLAREWPTDLGMWRAHITANVLPALRRELHMRDVVIRSHDLASAAVALRNYYTDHLAEIAQHEARGA